jgi:hypothetical protein
MNRPTNEPLGDVKRCSCCPLWPAFNTRADVTYDRDRQDRKLQYEIDEFQQFPQHSKKREGTKNVKYIRPDLTVGRKSKIENPEKISTNQPK